LSICAAVLIVCGLIGVYPTLAARYGLWEPEWLRATQLKLGLDLKGGVHLVLRVRTDEALRLETDAEAERLREELSKIGITAARSRTIDATHFAIDAVSPDQGAALRRAAADAQNRFDLASQPEGTYLFSMKPSVQLNLREAAVVQDRESVERRVNELGVAEPSIARQGEQGDQILVQLPGVTDVNRAKEIIQSTGLLEFKIIEKGPSSMRDALLINGAVPDAVELLLGSSPPSDGPSATAFYLVRKVPVVTGSDIRSARASVDENNQPAVAFTIRSDGARRFAKATQEHLGDTMAIVLDKEVRSIARIEGRIADHGIIHGSFSPVEVQNLSLILRSGALSAPMDYMAERTIGPSLGADSVRSGVAASIAGLALVTSFLLVYYRFSGVNAVVTLVFNLIILLGLMAYVGAVLTLPGIAGFVLTMGIGVDSNVLIFERIKEELEAGRGVRASVNAGFSRVFWTLVDTHVAALISCAFLFQFGTGPIRGFATTLFIGLVSNLFASIFVSRTVFEIALRRQRKVETLSI